MLWQLRISHDRPVHQAVPSHFRTICFYSRPPQRGQTIYLYSAKCLKQWLRNWLFQGARALLGHWRGIVRPQSKIVSTLSPCKGWMWPAMASYCTQELAWIICSQSAYLEDQCFLRHPRVRPQDQALFPCKPIFSCNILTILPSSNSWRP